MAVTTMHPKPVINSILADAHNFTLAFWKAFKLPWCKFWPDSSYSARNLAATLMQEEFNELVGAATPVEELDAFCDLLYVTAGAMHSVGYERALILTPFTNENYTGPLAESIKLIREPGIVCHRRLQVSLPEACYGITCTALDRYKHFHRAFAAVHAANMSKLWSTLPEDLTHYTAEPADGNKWLVKRREDGKVVKSPQFKHPDLTPYA